jgi:TonB family protein
MFPALYGLGIALAVATSAFADSTEVAGLTPSASAKVGAAILFEDAMPQGPSVTDRLAIIREKIQNSLEYPPISRIHSFDGDAVIRFDIDRAGTARNIRVARSSGHTQLDTSAIRAVETSSPLPWVYGALEVPVHFELTAPR